MLKVLPQDSPSRERRPESGGSRGKRLRYRARRWSGCRGAPLGCSTPGLGRRRRFSGQEPWCIGFVSTLWEIGSQAQYLCFKRELWNVIFESKRLSCSCVIDPTHPETGVIGVIPIPPPLLLFSPRSRWQQQSVKLPVFSSFLSLSLETARHLGAGYSRIEIKGIIFSILFTRNAQ